MIRELLDGLTTKEQRVLGWSTAAAAAALWLSVAWAEPLVLLFVPLAGVAFWFVVRRHRSGGFAPLRDDPDEF
jgi:Flp pilus assembly protein TadB